MESLLFIIDACAIAVIVFFSLKNDTLRPGMPQIGLFRATEDVLEPPPPRTGRGATAPARRVP